MSALDSRRMDSGWVTVLVAVIGATATLTGVLLTQRAATAREQRDKAERAEERRFEAEQAIREIEANKAQALLERRVVAHEAFLRACTGTLDAVLDSLGASRDARADGSRQALLELYDALTLVRMFAGNASVVAAERVMDCARVLSGSGVTSADWQELHAAVADYRSVMRQDLGTGH